MVHVASTLMTHEILDEQNRISTPLTLSGSEEQPNVSPITYIVNN